MLGDEPLVKMLTGKAAALLPWLLDETVTDILVNGTEPWWVEKNGELILVADSFAEAGALSEVIERILIPLGKRIDWAHPYADGSLPDGSRFHIFLSPIATSGPYLSFRKRRGRAVVPIDAFADSSTGKWLKSQVIEKKNIIFAGATGSGKTTLLARMVDEIPGSERVIILEETREIVTCHAHAIGLEARPASPDGRGEVTLRDLLRNALRMRPDRLVVGEVRGAEAFDLLAAMNTGHRGTLTTLHSNGAREALSRLESLVMLAGYDLPLRAVRGWIAEAVDAVVYLERKGGERKVLEIIKVDGVEGEIYRLTPLLQVSAIHAKLPSF